MHRLARSALWLARFVAALILLWLGGFGWFVASSYLIRADSSNTTDAIVVVTGGRQRLETGLELLSAGKAKKLFISGVNQHVDRDELLHTLGPLPENAACCIILGHTADNTFGNARESAEWMHEEGYRSLRLVTSWYHMRRSLLEFARAMPRVMIVPHPVYAHHVDPERWWSWHGAPLLVLGEYDKYLFTWALPLLQLWWPPPPAGPPVRTTENSGAQSSRAPMSWR
jgi:uncharacterized SAM-binding protein YcdF (DUF218 family)